MPFLVAFIVISFVFYIFYKVKYVRSKQPYERRWISAKSSMALGLFVALFGVNQLFLFHTTVTYIVAAIFIVMGVSSIWTGWKAYKHFLPLAIEEAEGK
ncbi:YtpI family protein [Bacillus sp. CGMCC 1.16607]|uniref:YtpI family protein n=1 Tax=Bacillus sp. CGMCC 1.16607 TaxID=3351842 RepID=UPI00363A4FF6